MKTIQASALVLVLLMSSMIALLPSAQAEQQEVCCNSVETTFYLIGSGAEASFTPYEERLGETAEEAEIANAVNSEEEVASWRLSGIYAGNIPDGDWDFSIPYEIEDASGAQVNMSLTVRIGNDEFTSTLPAQSSFLASGAGVLSISVPIESLATSEGESIEVTLSARSVIFQAPVQNAKMVLKWGSVDEDASITAQFPFVKMIVPDPVVDGGDVFVSVVILSPWGMDILAYSDASISVNGVQINTESIKTRSGDGVRATWTWSDGEGGEQTISVLPKLDLTDSGPSIQENSATFSIYISNPGDGSGTFYPLEEPLRSTGEGSQLNVMVEFDLSKETSKLFMERTVTLEFEDEMAYWMRWTLDHMGSDDPTLSPSVRIFDAGSVTDEQRVNQIIDKTEMDEFEQQMSRKAVSFLNQGLGIDAEDLLGDWDEKETSLVNLDLLGENRVVQKGVRIEIKVTSILSESSNNEQQELLQDFIKVQPVQFWSSYDLTVTGQSTGMTSFGGATVTISDSFDTRTFRTPVGESFTFKAVDLDQDEVFSINYEPSKNPVDSAMPLFALSVLGMFAILSISIRITRGRKKSGISLSSLVLFPVILLTFFIGMPSEIVGIAIGVAGFIFLVVSLLSPRTAKLVEEISRIFPTIDCPACNTSNEITSEERPLRIVCRGCQRTMKIVA